MIVAAVSFLIALLHVSGKPGRAWAAIRESEPAALAAGVNITVYKLWAFALASFMTGVAGGLLAGSVGVLASSGFPTTDSLTLLAVTLMGGIYSLWGAVVAGLLFKLLPALLQDWGLSSDIATILFGVGVLQVLRHRPRRPRVSGAEGPCEPGSADRTPLRGEAYEVSRRDRGRRASRSASAGSRRSTT